MPTVQQKRGTAAALASVNPILLSGELVFESDTRRSKIGDGTTAWNSLPYTASVPSFSAGGDLTGTYPNPQIAPGAVVTADIADAAVTDAKIAAVSAAKLTGTIADARLSGNVVLTGDARLSDARTPLAHAHDAAAITTGTVAAARLPLASRAQAQDGASLTVVQSPASTLEQIGNVYQLDLSQANVWSSGNGTLWQTAFAGSMQLQAGNATGGGTVIARHGGVGSPTLAKWNGATGNLNGRRINWTRRQRIRIRITVFSSLSTNAVFRCLLGKSVQSAASAGPLDRRGIGFEIRSGNALWLTAHNGTARADVAAGATLAFSSGNGAYYEIAVESDGLGNVSLLLDNASVATTSAGPATDTTDGSEQYFSVELATTDAATANVFFERHPQILRP